MLFTTDAAVIFKSF